MFPAPKYSSSTSALTNENKKCKAFYLQKVKKSLLLDEEAELHSLVTGRLF